MKFKKVLALILLFYSLRFLYYCIFVAYVPVVVFLDVGQGDSAVINTGKGAIALVDGGASYDADALFEKYSPFPSCTDALLFASHNHDDHTVGLARLLKRCPAPTLTFNDIYSGSGARDLNLKINSKKINYNSETQSISLDGFVFYILWPNEVSTVNTEDENANSLVFLLVYKDFTAFFTGDATSQVLESLNYEKIAPFIGDGIDVYKVPHHGSKTGISQKVMEILKPKNCVISVGKNSFGHPNPKAVKILEENGCRIMRTDLLGNIEFKIR